MRLFLNCSNLRFGGGKTVSFNIIRYYVNKSDIQLFIIAPAGCGYEAFNGQGTKLVLLPKVFNKGIAKPFLNYLILPVLATVAKCDAIVSLGNVAFPSFKPQILLIQIAYLVYPENIVWHRLGKELRMYNKRMVSFIKINLRFADIYCLQTETMRRRFVEMFNYDPEKIGTLPNVVSYLSYADKTKAIEDKRINENTVSLLFLSKYYVHKNFEILFELIPLILERSTTIRISLTISESEGDPAAGFLQKLSAVPGHEQVVSLLGNVKMEDIPQVYGEHDGLFLPTLLESFSGTYIEAMFFERPIFTSDLDFAHDVCKDAAFYFDPLDAESIINTIENAFLRKGLIEEKIKEGTKIVEESPSWQEVGQKLDSYIEKLT